MGRRNILEVIEDIISLLRKEHELSVKGISEGVNSQWETTIKALEFMKNVGLVKERDGRRTNRVERLFSLRK